MITPDRRSYKSSFRRISLTVNLYADIRTWFSNVEQHASEGVNKILVGNKCDWEEKRTVSTQEGQALADELHIPFLEVSAKSNINIEKAFYNLASEIKKRMVDSSRNEGGGGGGGGGAGGILGVGAGGAGAGGAGVNIDGSNSGNGMGGKCC